MFQGSNLFVRVTEEKGVQCLRHISDWYSGFGREIIDRYDRSFGQMTGLSGLRRVDGEEKARQLNHKGTTESLIVYECIIYNMHIRFPYYYYTYGIFMRCRENNYELSSVSLKNAFTSIFFDYFSILFARS